MRIVAAIGLAVLAACSKAQPAEKDVLPWRDGGELSAVLADASARGKPVMLYFTMKG